MGAVNSMALSLTVVDYVVLVVYVISTVAVGWWAGKKKMETTEDFFLAGRSANVLAVAVSLISDLTSGISFLGSPGYSYEHGLGIVFQSAGLALSTPFVVWLTIPFFARCGCATAYGYLEERFSIQVRT